MKKNSFLMSLLLSMCLLLSGCSTVTPEVSVTVYPMKYLAERIGGNCVKVNMITDDDVLIQSANIKKDYKDSLEESGALFYIHELEPYFDIYINDIRESHVNMIDLGSRGTFYKFERYNFSDSSQSTLAMGSPYYEGNYFNTVDMYKVDPMLWMDPISLIGSAGVIKDYLKEQYPAYGEVFEENYEQLSSDLTQLDVEFRDLKNSSAKISFACMSPSFGMWQKSYGVKVYPITLSRFGALPSEAQLGVIKQRLIDDDVKYIAYEPNMSEDMKKLYEEVKTELGLEEIKLSNLSTLSAQEKKENKDYLTIMYENLAMLEKIAQY